MKEVKIEEAWKKKYPEQVSLAVTISKDGKPDIIALGWVMPTSFNPPMVAISVGKTRYTHKLLSEIPEFVLCFPSEKQKDAMIFCGTHSGKDHDKFKETGLKPVKAKYVKPPLIEGSVAAFECKVVATLDTGDHTIFVGEILTAYISETEEKRIYNFGNYFKSISND